MRRSEKKYKRCHGSVSSPRTAYGQHLREMLLATEAQRVQRERQQGLGRQISRLSLAWRARPLDRGEIRPTRSVSSRTDVADRCALEFARVNRGRTLRPLSQVSFGYKLAKPQPFDKDEIVAAGPLTFSFNEVQEEPDRCAFRLVRRIYEAFGLFEEDMSSEFDRESGRMILPGA